MRKPCRKAKTMHNIGEVDHRTQVLPYSFITIVRKECSVMSNSICIISKNGERLMPTFRPGRVRHLLKDGKAKIVKHQPFTIQLLYDSNNYKSKRQGTF